MIKDIIENEEYKNLVEKQIKENILFLLQKNQECHKQRRKIFFYKNNIW